MTPTLNGYLDEARRVEYLYREAFKKKSLDSMSTELLTCYATVLESHARRVTIGMCEFPFTISRIGRRCPGFFKCNDEFYAKLIEEVPSAAKHEFHYHNASGAWHGLADTSKRKSVSNGNPFSLLHARYLGLSWAFAAVGNQVQPARYDFFAQVVESGSAVAKSLAEAFEASAMNVYSEQFSDGLATSQSDLRKFLDSETAKQRAKSSVFVEAAEKQK